jgi:hypothetical protein
MLGSGKFRRLLVVCIALVVLISGCTTDLVPPDHPANPTAILLSDYGKHSSLLLPDPSGGPNSGMEEYAFGDWNYFALGRKNLLVGLHALVHSPQSTLGRRWLPISAGAPYANELIGAKRTQRIIVNADRVAALRHDLDLEFARHSSSELYKPEERLYFVKSDASYNLLHNCNSVTAEWLKELGVEVHGFALTSMFKIQAASAH